MDISYTLDSKPVGSRFKLGAPKKGSLHKLLVLTSICDSERSFKHVSNEPATKTASA